MSQPQHEAVWAAQQQTGTSAAEAGARVVQLRETGPRMVQLREVVEATRLLEGLTLVDVRTILEAAQVLLSARQPDPAIRGNGGALWRVDRATRRVCKALGELRVALGG
jgi:hypothetical protein